MDVNDDACFLIKRSAFKSIASKLAPSRGLARDTPLDRTVRNMIYSVQRYTP
jgi:hypothetical protein